MLEVGAAITIATQSFNLLRKAVAAGRDIEQMSSDLGRWMSACSDIERREKENKKPPLYKKLAAQKSVQQEALELYAAKKTLEKQRYELKMFLIATHGMKSWDDLIKLEGSIRKQRQEEVYRRREFRQKIIEWAVIILTVSTGLALLLYFAWLYRESKA